MNEFFFLVAALAGVFVKIVDQIEDAVSPERRGLNRLKYPLAVLYGILIGYVISFSSFSSLWLAALFAQFMTGKIDKQSHFIGFFVALVFAFAFGIGEFRMLDFFVLILFAAADEIPLFQFFGPDLRVNLKFAALVFGFFGRWDYFIAIMAFDMAYYSAGRLIPKSWYKKKERA